MKLIRWLFSNIILIAFVLALTYAYVYWDNLTGEDTPAGKVIAYLSVEYDEVREFLDDYDYGADQTDEVVEPEVVAEAPQTASVPQAMPQSRQQPVMQQPMSQPRPQMRPPAQQPVPPQAMMQQPPARQPSRPPVPPQAMTQEPPRQAMPPQREPMPAPADQQAATDKPVPGTREQWISAREEYHRGNIDVSIRNYKEVIANSSDNYDAYGELGNVYLSRGNYKEAANAYFEAASILVKLGHVNRARSLLPMLGRLDRAKAEELNQLINASNT